MMYAIVFAMSILWTMINQLGLHYFPWHVVLGRKLPRVAAYVLGVLGFLVPATGCLSVFGLVAEGTHASIAFWMMVSVAVVWAHVIAAGVAVISAYLLDHIFHLQIRILELSEEMSTRQKHGATS